MPEQLSVSIDYLHHSSPIPFINSPYTSDPAGPASATARATRRPTAPPGEGGRRGAVQPGEYPENGDFPLISKSLSRLFVNTQSLSTLLTTYTRKT